MILASIALAATLALPPTEFTSDGCTYWFDGNYNECCEAHDLDYWMGGTYFDRLTSDAKLARCVARKGHPVHAWLMHAFTRALGPCWLPWSHRWGAGWPWPQCGPNDAS